MRIDNEKLPAPNEDELHYSKKAYYVDRMYKEVDYVKKYGITNSDFCDWVVRTFDEYYVRNKHITYRESKKTNL